MRGILHDRFVVPGWTPEPQQRWGSDTADLAALIDEPLPPVGPVAVVLVWPGFGTAESRTVLDGAAVRAAASSRQILWTASVSGGGTLAAATPPRLPPGWFAEPAG
jgi:hypothetical protein